ncbi:MAG: DUF1592 domain-containing protein [Myxococcota bacterium]
MRFYIALLASALAAGCSEPPGTTPGGGTPGELPELRADESGEAGLRRLTAAQFSQSIAELIGRDRGEREEIRARIFETGRLPSERTVHGFENYGAVQRPSAALVEAHLRSSLVAAEFGEPLCGDRSCERALTSVAERAFRGPLDASDQEALRALLDSSVDPFNGAFLAVQWILQHPRFLYLIERGEGEVTGGRIALTDYEVAARLSFFLWGSVPDERLMNVASAGRLSTPEEVASEAARMFDDRRARHGMRELHRQWLDFDRVERINPDFLSFELFRVIDDPNDAEISQIRLRSLVRAMRSELEMFVEAQLFDGPGTLRALLTSTKTHGDHLIRYLYGLGELPDEDSLDAEECEDECPLRMRSLDLDPSRRGGFLTLASHNAAHSYPRQPAPIRRSMFVLERFLCEPPPPPPPGIDPSGVTGRMGDARTNRERHSEHTTNSFCAGCHRVIDPIGFSFERYDAIGGYRTEDNGFPVDSSGDLRALNMDVEFSDAVQLSAALAESPRVQACVSRQWMRYALGHDIRASDLESLRSVATAFQASDGSFRELALAIVQSPSFLTREVSQ